MGENIKMFEKVKVLFEVLFMVRLIVCLLFGNLFFKIMFLVCGNLVIYLGDVVKEIIKIWC